MCDDDALPQPVPSKRRTEINALLARLYEAQHATTQRVQAAAGFENLGDTTPDGFTVNDTLWMWVWHFWSHHRDLIRARGPLIGDDPHFHVPHYVRQANEAFGAFIGELACMGDEYLDARLPEGGRTVREIVVHVLDTLETYVPKQVEQAVIELEESEGGSDDD
jgi:uncharacterized damage-inducible protein DinB